MGVRTLSMSRELERVLQLHSPSGCAGRMAVRRGRLLRVVRVKLGVRPPRAKRVRVLHSGDFVNQSLLAVRRVGHGLWA